MKKSLPILALLPTLSFAHESQSFSSIVHAVEHNLANPVFAVVLLVGLVGLTVSVVKAIKR